MAKWRLYPGPSTFEGSEAQAIAEAKKRAERHVKVAGRPASWSVRDEKGHPIAEGYIKPPSKRTRMRI